MTASKPGGGVMTRALHRAEGMLISGAATAFDLLPPRLRYGHARRVLRLLKTEVPTVPRTGSLPRARREPHPAMPGGLACTIVAGHLDVGGIGTVVEELTVDLVSQGFRPAVLTDESSLRGARLSLVGIPVAVASDMPAALAALRTQDPEVVQTHEVSPPHLAQAVRRHGAPTVVVLHNTEIHYTARRWHDLGESLDRAHAAIAVSETVRAFHSRHLPAGRARAFSVVPNGFSDTTTDDDPAVRAAARGVLDRVVGPLHDDVVLLTLGRYDSQKNIPGTVAGFLEAAGDHPDLRLVVAGDISDWLEFRRADALRRAHPEGARVHLLGVSDAATLLLASDAFLLDSFFEGWPMAATEAQAAGLPLILADVGGARELVARDPARSVVVRNAVGDAEQVSDRSVRTARRRTRRQSNRSELAGAVVATAALVRAERASGRTRPPAIEDDTGRAMAAGHAAVLRSAAQGASPIPPAIR